MACGGWAGQWVFRSLNSTVCLWLSPSVCVDFSELLTSLSQTHNGRTHTAALLGGLSELIYIKHTDL